MLAVFALGLFVAALGVRPSARKVVSLPPKKRGREVGAKGTAAPARRSSKRLRDSGPRESFAPSPRYKDGGASRRKPKRARARAPIRGTGRKTRLRELGRAGGHASAAEPTKLAIARKKWLTKKRQRDEDTARIVEAKRNTDSRRLSLRPETLIRGKARLNCTANCTDFICRIAKTEGEEAFNTARELRHAKETQEERSCRVQKRARCALLRRAPPEKGHQRGVHGVDRCKQCHCKCTEPWLQRRAQVHARASPHCRN